MAHEAAFSRQHSAVSKSQNQHQNQKQKAFTAKDAQPPQQAKTGLAGGPGHAKEEKGLPQMDADERGLGERREPVRWKPTPDMYRIDTLEVREAYEASVSDEKRAATGRRMEAGASGHRTERTSQVCCTPKMRQR